MTQSASAFAPPVLDVDGRRDLVGLSQEELTEAVLALGEPRFRAK